MGTATHHISLIAMGRRKIDIAYINDDRVRKVTFCKRKGGLFKKAEDLSKLCGVEIAVVIVSDRKTSEFASTDMDRILDRYKDLRTGGGVEQLSETSKLWEQLENQRRELESLTRELTAERRKVEELRSSSMGHAIGVVPKGTEAAENNQAPLSSTAVHDPMSLQNVCVQPILSVQPTLLQPLSCQIFNRHVVPAQHIMQHGNASADTLEPLQLATAPVQPVAVPLQPAQDSMQDGNASDDTAEVDDTMSEGGGENTMEDDSEPAAKRLKMKSLAEGAEINDSEALLAVAAEAILCQS